MWQRQWDVSEKGRFYGLKPKVNKKPVFDFPDRKQYSLIAQLRIGYAKRNDYLHKIGVSETSKCTCGEVETIEHYLLHCENYFNERERMRTVLFQQTGIADLTLDALLGCNDSDLKKVYPPFWVIISLRPHAYSNRRTHHNVPGVSHKKNYREILDTIEILLWFQH